MQADIHPSYNEVTATCSCGAEYKIYSDKELKLDICSNCHPFYTGKQKLVDTAGRIDRFRERFGSRRRVVEEAKQSDEE